MGEIAPQDRCMPREQALEGCKYFPMGTELEPLPESDELLEIDGRRSGRVYYQIVVHLGSSSLGLIARSPDEVRAIAIPGFAAKDALAHPEVYLSAEDTIHAFE